MSVDVSTAQCSGRKPDEEIASFVNTGRTGRRNAIPDIHLDPNATLTTAGLAEQLHRLISEKLTSGDNCCQDHSLSSMAACSCECHTGSSSASTLQESLESSGSQSTKS